MGYEKRHIRVFLSSSMAEFRREREAIKLELDRRDIPNFVFEQEGASGEDPGTIFREAVQGASVYVGIFGKACGAYTKEEFELARAQHIVCHLYVQEMASDERSHELQQFLESLSGVSDVPSLFYFSSTDTLADRIIQDLWSWVDRLVGQAQQQQAQQEDQLGFDINDHLPILCDRDPQEIQFESQITAYFQQRSSRPLLLLLPGPVKEAHGLYVKRVQLSSLETWLNKAGVSGVKQIKNFVKSPCAMTSPSHIRDEIIGLLKERKTGGDQAILDHMRAKRMKALLLVVQILASECDGKPTNSLQLLAEYWASFPDTPQHHVLGMVVCLRDDQLATDSQGLWQRLFSRSQGDRSTGGLFDQPIKQIQEQYQDRTRLRVEVLPQLTSPKSADVRRWLEHDLVKAKVPFVPGKEIDAMFQGRDSLPMDDLYEQLSKLMKKQTG